MGRNKISDAVCKQQNIPFTISHKNDEKSLFSYSQQKQHKVDRTFTKKSKKVFNQMNPGKNREKKTAKKSDAKNTGKQV